MLLADRGYDANWMRAVTDNRPRANIPPHKRGTHKQGQSHFFHLKYMYGSTAAITITMSTIG